MNDFKKGDKVKYTSGHYGDSLTNPLWDGKYGRITGEVTLVIDNSFDSGHIDILYRVKWANGFSNSYYHNDIRLLDTIENKLPKDLFTL